MIAKLKQVFHHDAAGGVLLVFAALLAMVMANTPLVSFYNDIFSTPVAVKFGAFEVNKPLILWVNDGLMAIFFFLVGLEVKREVLAGHLQSRDQIMLPAIGAIAGITVPALIYVFFNYDEPVGINGWAIPAATDIAFALGVFSLFGKSLPITLKLFLLSVAIFDDIGAIIIIALFYSAELSTTSLVIAAIGLSIMFVFNRMKVKSEGMYIIIGVIIWAAVLKSGVHATLAGFAMALFIPLKGKNRSGQAMLPHLEHKLHPWVAFAILPIFAFANAGVQIVGTTAEQIFNPIVVGVMAGLFIGKQVGIFGACWLAVKVGVAKLPAGVTMGQLYGASILCGIGFTMSLFIGTLAFENVSVDYLNSVKVGVLAGSLLSAILGGIVISRSSKRFDKRHATADQTTV
ncbi:Na+/H+ antiporter NhaA [Glaciecola sp. MH2013]|uniref:Na+/H+ antiporter NhaA n=1 Tax=Glaciecola sp. MH2013 TaxID=2785524 RepID=UPI0018A0F6D9|nr:Na+/H+ antiporter NhaA [Glaciecola sp. MH2013]MBF7072542.1 Na+/H+ antiporter NhaA [Glaciecola sp. MH2013]